MKVGPGSVRLRARFTTYTPSPAHNAAAARVIIRPDIAALFPLAVSSGVYWRKGAGTILTVRMILLGSVAEAKAVSSLSAAHAES
jgi:hypothetical protein